MKLKKNFLLNVCLLTCLDNSKKEFTPQQGMISVKFVFLLLREHLVTTKQKADNEGITCFEN